MASKLHGDGTGATILRLHPDAPDPHARVVLANTPPFRLGQVAVEPARCRLAHSDGREEKLQPRIMQVLIALARAEGGIVTRDMLTDSCWDGRIVGEDAISRAIAKVRGLAEGIGAGAFAIETVPKIGYRLARTGEMEPHAPSETAPRPRPSRRLVLAGGAVAAAALAGAGFLWLPRGAPPPDSAADDPLMALALAAFRQTNPVGNNQAIGLLRQLVDRSPDRADAWGLLAIAYFEAYWGRGFRHDDSMAVRARAAMQRARQLDPHNVYAQMAGIWELPLIGTWAERERLARACLAEHPDNDLLLQSLAYAMALVGRWSEAAAPIARALALAPTVPLLHYLNAIILWSLGRLEETDRAIDRGLALLPADRSLWFARFYVDLYGGRTGDAIALAEDRAGRPVGVAEEDFEQILALARAVESRRPADIDAVMRTALERAHQSVGRAEGAIHQACALGRVDAAFAVAEALYFGRGFDPGETRYGPEEASFNRHNDRRTYLLFQPPAAPMRADPRFAALVEEIGLERYWRETGSVPDYRRRAVI